MPSVIQSTPSIQLIMTFTSMPEHPESFPVNALVPIPGTPMESNEVNEIARDHLSQVH